MKKFGSMELQINRNIAIIFFVLVFGYSTFGQDAYEWRGAGRTGLFNETGLLESWPENGPELLWTIDGLPNGYSSVSIWEEMIYLTGIEDSLDVLIAVDLNGVIQWQTPFGRAWEDSYNPSKCTPTVNEGLVYVLSGLGDIACVDGKTGAIVWKVKASNKYEGSYGKWGLSESLLLMDDKVFFTPGGNKTTMIALDKNTGEEIWVSKSLEDNPSFTSPLLLNWAGQWSVVNLTQNYIFAADPASGEIKWTFDFGQYAGGESKRNNQTNTPIFDSGKLFVTSGYDHKSIQLQLSDDGNDVSVNWVDSVLDVHHGGVVKIGDYLYGANWVGNRMGNWACLEWNTGQKMYETEWENKGSIVSADGMLYCYEEKNGNIALAKATPEGFNVISSFEVTQGKGPHWSHPVIQDKKLFIRHGTTLMVYSVAK